MNAIRITNSSHTTTSVPNEFIDYYMPKANGEQVKVYLFLLRMASSGQAPTLTELSANLMQTEEDILGAMNYWQQQHLISLTLNAHRQIQYIELLPMENIDSSSNSYEFTTYQDSPKLLSTRPGSPKARQIETQPVANFVPPTPAKEQHTPVELEAFTSSGELSTIIYEAEELLKLNLTQNDINTLYYFSNQLRFPAPLIEFLIVHCAELGKTSMRYLEKVAIDWHKHQILTVAKAKEYVASHNVLNNKVAKAFGIYGRLLADGECAYVTRWVNEYCFDDSLILEACTRTIDNTHSPSFAYAEKILVSWKKAGVHKLDDIKTLDKDHSKNKATGNKTKKNPQIQGNGFHNFEQRDYDYDDMTKKYVAQLNHSTQS